MNIALILFVIQGYVWKDENDNFRMCLHINFGMGKRRVWKSFAAFEKLTVEVHAIACRVKILLGIRRFQPNLTSYNVLLHNQRALCSYEIIHRLDLFSQRLSSLINESRAVWCAFCPRRCYFLAHCVANKTLLELNEYRLVLNCHMKRYRIQKM